MLDVLCTAIVPIILCAFVLFPFRRKEEVNIKNFFSKDFTTALKGIAAIVVIFVHVPEARGNILQDMIGSFAYVAVTFFFLVSAYGMQLACEHKYGYMSVFWKNRLASLLIPMLLVNIFCYVAKYLSTGTAEAQMLYKLNAYVSVLLTYCLWFWCLEMIARHFNISRRVIDIINMTGVAASSILLYVLSYSEISADAGWCFERMGFVWGLLLFRYFPNILRWIERRNRAKRTILLLLAVGLGVAYLKYKGVYFWGEYMLKVVLGLTILLCLSVWAYKMNFGKKILLFLGSISFEIYLLHGMIMSLLGRHLNLPSGLFIVTSVVTTIIVAYVINAIHKPIVKKVRQLELRRRKK